VALWRRPVRGLILCLARWRSCGEEEGSLGLILAFQGFPLRFFFRVSHGPALSPGVMQRVGFNPLARFFGRSLGITGVEATAAASHVFVGIE